MRIFRGLAAGVLTLAIVGGFPYLLVRFIGNPYPPEGIALDAQLTDNAILGLLAVIVWVLWAQFTLGLLLEVYAALVDRPIAVRVPVLGIQQDLARVLVGAIITTTVAAPLGVGLDSAYATTPAAASPADPDAGDSIMGNSTVGSFRGSAAGSSAPDQRQQGDSHQGSHHVGPRPGFHDTTAPQQQEQEGVGGAQLSVTVQRGDSLWSLAETYFGDGDRWSEIAEANSGRVMVDGTPFISAGQIRPGWSLTIPGVAPSRLPNPERDERSAPGASTEVESAYRVEAGDTLWDIAEEHLGDPTRYPEIAVASRGTIQPSGVRLSDPDVIDVGWIVTIPPSAGDSGERTDRAPTGPRQQPGAEPGRRAVPHGQAAGPKAEEGRGAGADRAAGQGEQQRAPQDPPWGSGAEAPGVTGGSSPQTRGGEAVLGGGDRSGERARGSRGSAASMVNGADEAGADQQQGWMVSGLAGGGLVLAGGLLLGLRVRRRAQFRNRRPGRTVAAPPADLAAVEKSIAVSTRAAATVEDLEAALRSVAAWSAAEGLPLPALAAVELTVRPAGGLVLHLAHAARLPSPWLDVQGDALHWRWEPTRTGHGGTESLVGSDGLESVDPPYPLLATVGSSRAGDVWLLNLEQLGEVRVTGDPARGRDLVRYLVAEVAMNPWSYQAQVDCVGLAAELAPMDPDRIQVYDPSDPAAIARALDDATTEASRTVDRARTVGGTAATGRTGQLDEDAWPARLFVLDHPPSTQDSHDDQIKALLDLIRTHPGRTATAVVLLEEQPDVEEPAGDASATQGTRGMDQRATSGGAGGAAVEVQLDPAGRLSLTTVGLELDAVSLSAQEARGCASLLAQAASPADVVDREVPVDASADQGWPSYADLSGALRREHTTARDAPREELDEPTDSVLPSPTAQYVREAAITEDDLAALAPQVPLRVRAEIEDVDPTLDADLADWFDQTCRRPRLRLLGPVTAEEARGRPPVKQRAYITELMAYLALRRPRGATSGEVATAFGITTAKTRDYIRVLRAWLGENPRTGELYLPNAGEGSASQIRGLRVYQIDQDVLLDVDLFARLRLRGEARGSEGIEDLRSALRLVTGRPFDQLRGSGWAWLVDQNRPDQHMTSAVADVAFLVVTHHLERHEIARARAAAEIGALAAPDEEATRLCLVRVCKAEGNGTEADRILRAEVCNRTDDNRPPPDLSERTIQIMRNHHWLQTRPPSDRQHGRAGDVAGA